jgi:RNA polymerase sigma-70 factor (ECF subfamily)
MHYDTTFILQLKRQDPKAVKSWYLAHFEFLMRQASRFFIEQNEQLTAVHNAQLKALKHLDQFTPGTSMEAWLSVILRNELIDLYRKNQRWKFFSFQLSGQVAETADFEFELDRQIEQKRVEQILKDLPPTTRFVFGFYVFEEMKPRQIAEHLKMNLATVRWHLKFAKQQLKKTMRHD